jgi:hypothetical protein
MTDYHKLKHNKMKIILALIIFVMMSFQAAKSQSVFPNGNYKIEYKNEVAGKDPYTIMLYKKDSVYKLVRTENNKSFITIIDYSAGKYYDIFIDKNKTGNKYNKINYNIITAMWHIIFNGITTELKTYQKLSDKQTVLGKECDVYDSGKLSVMNSTSQYFFFGDSMLKMEKPGHVIEAVSIDENPVFTDDEFKIPDDINWLFEY